MLSQVVPRTQILNGVTAARTISTLVTPKWLLENMKNTKVLDGSWYMPSEQRDTYEEFLKNRIQSASFFGIDEIADKSSPFPHMLPSEKLFSDAIGNMGIGNKDHVVVYDTKGIFSSCRVYWTFKAFGHEKVSILSGGFPDWLAANYPTDSGPLAPATPVQYTAKLNPQLVRTFEQIIQNIELRSKGSGEMLVDARSEGRFTGKAPEPRPGLPSGPIPYSLNTPFQEVLDREGRHFLAPAQLAEIFSARGVDITKPTILSCGSGVTASILYVALELVGNKELSVYDGSWTEYATRALLKKSSS